MNSKDTSNIAPQSTVALTPEQRTTSPQTRSRGKELLLRLLLRPETVPLVLLVLAFIGGSLLSPYFLDLRFLLNNTSTYIEIGIMALGMVFVIISGNIDLSVASTLALVACIAGVTYFDLGVPMGIALPLALILGGLLGYLNGVLVTRLKLPSLAVTLATLALYRGVANILVGDDSRPKLAWSRDIVFPKWFVGVHQVTIFGIPFPLFVFLVLAILLGLLLHKTVFGRWVYTIGNNRDAARYSGVPVEWVERVIFALAGLLSGLAGMIMVSRLSVARYDHARGWELDVITAVVLGGVDIRGGRGSMLGAVIAFFLIFVLRTGMGVANVKAESQLFVIGALLILSVIVSNVMSRFRR
jgi:rhamnose transport system permease protein